MRALILPPHDRWPRWTSPPNPAEPDLEKPYRILAGQGWSTIRLDTLRRPWNPLARAHSVLGAIDPLRALRVLLLHRDADLVVGFFESSALIILLLRRLLRFRGRVVLYDIGVPGGWRLRNVILRQVVQRADMLLPLGGAQVAGLLALGAQASRVRAMLTCTYPDFYAAAPDRPDGYVLAVGDDASRDYKTLLEACAGLSRKVVIRSRLVAEDPARPNVSVIAHALTSVAYRDLLAGALLVVLPLRPSIHAGGVSTLIEAMSTAKPVIVSRSPGLADYLLDGVTCRIVPPEDPTALRDAIEQLAADAPARRSLAAAARTFIVEHCSPEALADRLARLWQSLGAEA